MPYLSYGGMVWNRFKRHRSGMTALIVVVLFCLVGIYAPFLASSKPLFVVYEGQFYFPLFRYLFYSGFYTKGLDLFFNLMIFTFPLFLMAFFGLSAHRFKRRLAVSGLIVFQLVGFLYLILREPVDPASDPALNRERQQRVQKHVLPDWNEELRFMNDYAKLNLIMQYRQRWLRHERLARETGNPSIQTLWEMGQSHDKDELSRQKNVMETKESDSNEVKQAAAAYRYVSERHRWLEEQNRLLHAEIMPLLSPFHWEDDAGGQQSVNQQIHFWELTRINHKDLTAALIFGVRISLVVGILSVGIALFIGVPVGALAGYYGGAFDIVVCRLLEIWESMPTFFMLLMIVAMTQSKSIFLVIAVIGLFGWTGFSRYIRGEFFKQRNLPYVEACKVMGFTDSRTIFHHILPNAIPPVLTLLPFAVMGAITSEAGLSFLGLGEEGSCSWGVLMDEGRTAFPGESYLLWPPALLLTLLLIAIALVGDSLRDALDPKMH